MRLTEYRALLIDCDEVLVDRDSGVWTALQPLLESHAGPLDKTAVLERVARRHPPHVQGNADLLAHRPAMFLEGIRRVLQAMVHMDGVHLPGPALRGREQEDGGIGAAAVGHRERQRQLQPGERFGRRVAGRIRRIRPWCRRSGHSFAAARSAAPAARAP